MMAEEAWEEAIDSTSNVPFPFPSMAANLADLKVDELKKELRARQLPVTGTKAVLLERLSTAMAIAGTKRTREDAGLPTAEADGTKQVAPAAPEIAAPTFEFVPNEDLVAAVSSTADAISGGLMSNFFSVSSCAVLADLLSRVCTAVARRLPRDCDSDETAFGH